MPSPRENLASSPSSSLSACLGNAAADALLAEAALPDKPGLVTPGRRGAHDDMDYPLMVASAEAVRPWFGTLAARALAMDEADPRSILASLRSTGMRAEADMFQATGGVNTHKGAIFSLGLLAAAAALVLGRRPAAAARGGSRFLGDVIRSVAARMAGGIVAVELEGAGNSAGASMLESAGERLHRELGAKGARGQAEAGYPIVGSRVLPLLRRARAEPHDSSLEEMALYDVACVDALLGAMSELEDTCVLSRGGLEGLAFVRSGALAVIRKGALATEEGRFALERFDADLVTRHLSPGGSADLLAAGIFLDAVEARFG